VRAWLGQRTVDVDLSDGSADTGSTEAAAAGTASAGNAAALVTIVRLDRVVHSIPLSLGDEPESGFQPYFGIVF